MKIEELMIGDLIQFKKSHTAPLPTKPVQIFGITYDGEISHKHLLHIAFCESGAVQYNYDPDIFEGIPITPEILEKNGMKPFEVDRLRDKHSSAKWWAKGGDFFVKQYNFKHNNYEPTYSVGCNYHSLIIGLKYVHELQHALRICGVNKVITL